VADATKRKGKKMVVSPSPLLSAALTLQHSKRYIESRCDGAWWLIDKLLWSDLMPLLSHSEHCFMIGYIATQNYQRAERLS
jgi:hypothetical protein